MDTEKNSYKTEIKQSVNEDLELNVCSQSIQTGNIWNKAFLNKVGWNQEVHGVMNIGYAFAEKLSENDYSPDDTTGSSNNW